MLFAVDCRPVNSGVMLLRIMTEEIFTHRRAYQATLAIGCVGAFGQASLLWHTLVNSYPYKMMSFPSSDFYANTGYTGLLVAPLLAIIVLFLLKLRQLWLVPALPVVLCPAFFWAMYKAAFLIREMRGNVAVGRNFGDTTPAMAEREFAQYALTLGLTGLDVGLVCGLLLWLLFKSKQNAYR
jgi:hypothetical protein